jgi:hypothetical protein
MIQEYFNDLFPDQGLYKLLWTLSGKRSFWFQDNAKMIEFISQNPKDIFYGLGMAEKKPNAAAHKRRLTINDITAIKVLNLDIDVQDEIAHKNNEKLPKSIDEARKIANHFIEPTWLIDSGHGLHAIYVLSELYEIRSDEDRNKIVALSQAFQEAHRAAFPEYKIDFTADIARVLRCPESVNCKNPEEPISCEIIEHGADQYWIEEIEDAIEFNYETYKANQEATTSLAKKSYHASNNQTSTNTATWTTKDFNKWFDDAGLVIDKDAEIDGDIWMELDSFDSRFSNVFHHRIKKRDTKGKELNEYKTDINGYDLDLANIAARMDLPDQQILDLMIHHRRYHGTNTEKICHERRDYYARTLLKAGVNKSITQLDKNGKSTEHSRATLLSYLSDKLQCGIQRIIRFNKDPNPVFELELVDKPGKTIKLGTFDAGIMNQRAFRGKIGAVGIKMPRPMKAGEWEEDIIPKIQAVTEDGFTPETATYEGQVSAWIPEYFEETTVVESFDEFLNHNDTKQPFIQDGQIYFKAEPLIDWIKNNRNHIADFSFLTTMIAVGFIEKKILIKGVKHSFWTTPPNFYIKKEEKSKSTVARA